MRTQTFTSSSDIRDDVTHSLASYVNDYDVDGIVSELIHRYGIDGYATIDMAEYWATVEKYDTTTSEHSCPEYAICQRCYA